MLLVRVKLAALAAALTTLSAVQAAPAADTTIRIVLGDDSCPVSGLVGVGGKPVIFLHATLQFAGASPPDFPTKSPSTIPFCL